MIAILYFVLAIVGITYSGIVLWRRQREDTRRVRASRDEANKAIEEYEAIYGPGSSPWARFK